MPVDQIPSRLTLPLSWASTVLVDGKTTARDLSYSMTVAWLSAQRPEAEDGKDIFVGDNGMRMALGMARRDKATTESLRVFRTVESKMTAAGIVKPAKMPSLGITPTDSGGIRVERSGMRIHGDAQLQWSVPAEVSASMRVRAGEPTIELPWTLMQEARTKVTVFLMLRLLSMAAGWQWGDNPASMKGDRLEALVALPAVLTALGLPARSEPKEVMRKHLVPAAAEIGAHTGYRVSITEQRTRYRRGPMAGKEGPLQGLSITLDIPATQDPLAFPAARVPYAPWKPAPKFHRPAKPQEPAPAFIDNVATIPVDDDDGDFFVSLVKSPGRNAGDVQQSAVPSDGSHVRRPGS